MRRLGTAIRAFFTILGDTEFARKIHPVIKSKEFPSAEPAALMAPLAKPRTTQPAAPIAKAGPDSALVLLAVLQREARLVDFLQESIASYSDAQVGAAVRDVHRDAAKTIERLFAVRPVRNESEGAAVEVPSAAAGTGTVRLVGNVSGAGPWRGTLRHAGWQATKVELPESRVPADAAKVIAPAEVEL